jgi:hypothetical protein
MKGKQSAFIITYSGHSTAAGNRANCWSNTVVSNPVVFKFLNVLVLNIAEKLLAGH